MQASIQKSVRAVKIKPPAKDQIVSRSAVFRKEGEKPSRYHLPKALDSGSPIGYRTRPSLTKEEADALCPLFSLNRPSAFVNGPECTDQEFFEESSLGILSARQSTNFRGHRQISLGAEDSTKLTTILKNLGGCIANPLHGASYSHIVLCRPYRTPFTMLLTLVGHLPLLSLLTVPIRALRKRFQHIDDIPTIGYLTHLHVGILADALERAVVISSQGRRKANVVMAPFTGKSNRQQNREEIRAIEALAGITPTEKQKGWKIAFVAQVGYVEASEQISLSKQLWRKAGALLIALRSERVQPGINNEEKAPEPYQNRQDMDVSAELTEMAGRAAFNAFSHWAETEREEGKSVLLLDRVDVLTPNGKERLREIREELGAVTDRVAANIPLWADLPLGRVFTKNTKRSRKAFALTGQRIYIAGLAEREVHEGNIPWQLAIRAVGAAAARSGLYVELCGSIDIPENADLLAGFCMMAGPVNQNDIGKTYYGGTDLLSTTFPGREPCSLLIWTVKAKTVADPIGNEEQLMNPSRKGALVDLRPAPHEVICIRRQGRNMPFRAQDGCTSQERAYGDQENFVRSPTGEEIPGNGGESWPAQWANAPVW